MEHQPPVEFNGLEIQGMINSNPSVEELLGYGGFGMVQKGKIPPDNEKGLPPIDVAIKHPRILSLVSDEHMDQWKVEKELLSITNHENIVKLVGFSDENNGLCLVYEFMPLQSLESHIDDLNWRQTLLILRGIVSAICYLHELNPPIIFKDLKCSNILLDNDRNPKLGDFGVAKKGEIGSNHGGTPGASDPIVTRVAREMEPITTSVDIWSIGMLILTLMTKRAKCLRKLPLNWHTMFNQWDKQYMGMRSTVKAGLRAARMGDILKTRLKAAWMGEILTGNLYHNHLKPECTKETATTLLKLAVKCTKKKSTKRPTIEQVRSIIESIPVPPLEEEA